jgi:hypothetical protein
MSKDEYATHDLYLSSFLMTQEGFKLKEIRDNGNGRKIFVFEPKPDNSLLLDFYNGKARVSAIRLLENLQTLKSATYVLNREKDG